MESIEAASLINIPLLLIQSKYDAYVLKYFYKLECMT
jgi:hypothetical protein